MFCCYARIIESYRVPGKKYPKVRILQNLGRYVELEARTRHRRTPDEGASTATRNGKGSPAEFCFAKYLQRPGRGVQSIFRSLSSGQLWGKIYARLWDDLSTERIKNVIRSAHVTVIEDEQSMQDDYIKTVVILTQSLSWKYSG